MSDDGGRRTQAERSAETIDVLLDSAIATIAELGYHRATTNEICRRAGVSPGALFHHFDTRVSLVLAALDRLVEQRVDRFVHFADTVHSRGHNDGAFELLHRAKELARDRGAMVWLEATMAARTDAELQARLQPSLAMRWAAIRGIASTSPRLANLDPARLEVWFQLLRSFLELDAILETVDPHPELEARKERALLAAGKVLGAGALAS